MSNEPTPEPTLAQSINEWLDMICEELRQKPIDMPMVEQLVVSIRQELDALRPPPG